ncbi:MAG: hypothetical protein ACK5YL_00470 [Holosporales bacterium]|jgi:hypothetical protein
MKDFNLENIPSLQGSSTNDPNLSFPTNEYGGIWEKPKESKPSFIKSRLTIDNFWNVMFFLGLNIGLGVAALTVVLTDRAFPTFSGILCWVTIIGVPYIVKRNSNITFDKEKLQFLNRHNEILNDRAPNFFLLIVLTAGLTALTGLMLDSIKSINDSIGISIVFMMITFIPTMYCILKNFPIVVYFKKETYIGDGTARSYSSDGTIKSSFGDNSIISPNNLANSPVNSWYSGNIYHRNR